VSDRPRETSITLDLEHCSAELAQAHRELYPERIPEADLDRVREYLSARPPLEFDFVRVTEFPGMVAYAEPQPDAEIRATMRGLWALYPELPPYGRPGFEPVPHATLTRYANPVNATFEQARARVEPLLPVHCIVTEAILQEEYELDRMRVRETFHFAG
jgi:2'-5' RNA ligase superfamily